MSGEDDVRVRAPHAVGEKRDEAGIVVPALDEDELRVALGQRLLELRAVAGDRAARVVRREHETDDRRRTGRERRLGRRRDPRLPVLHAGEDGHAELPLECGARLLRDRVERIRVLDAEPAVALDEILEQLGADRPAAADVRVVRRHVLQPVGAAVRHQHHRDAAHGECSWTSVVEPRERVGVRLRQHAVAEVEDVAGPTARAAQHVSRRLLDVRPRPEQDRRVEIALNAALCADRRPRAVELDTPVEPDDVAAGVAHVREEPGRAGAEVDRRHVDGVEHAGRVRRGELLVVGWAEDARPRVEELDHVGAGVDLRLDVRGEAVGEPFEQRVPHGGLPVHELLRREEVAAAAALHEVAGDRERPAAEADERLVRGQLGADQANRLQRRLGRRDRAQAVDVGGSAERRAPPSAPRPPRAATSTPMASTGVMMSAKSTAASTP